MKKKLFALAIIATTLFSLNASAQRTSLPKPGTPLKSEMKEGLRDNQVCCAIPDDRGRAFASPMDAMLQGIDLTEAQQKQIAKLKAERRKQHDKQRDKADKQRDKQRQDRRKSAEQMDKEMKKILTPAQYAQWEANKKAFDGKKGPKGQKGPKACKKGKKGPKGGKKGPKGPKGQKNFGRD